jgi:predicted Zn-dependent protease
VTRNLGQRLVIAICLLAITIVPLMSTTPTVASDQPNEFHWAREKSQFTVQAVNDVDGVWKKLLDQAVDNWNKSDVVTIKEVSGSHNASQDCDKTDGKITVCNWKYGTQGGWLGLTRLFFNKAGDHIAAATVQMNDSFFDQNGGKYNDDDARRHTMCHEMGHAIGLDHEHSSKSCMNDGGGSGNVDIDYAVLHYLVPINKDYKHLEQIYKHKDSSTTLAGKQKDGKKHKKDKDKDKKGHKHKKGKHKNKQDEEKDRKKRKRDRNRTESEGFFEPTALPAVPSGLSSDQTEIVQNLDDGSLVVTFITWAVEEP